MAAESITAFVQRFVLNSEDLEFLVLYLDGLGVQTLADLVQLPEGSWETLSSWLSPGTAPALRAELRCLVPPSGRSAPLVPAAPAPAKSSGGSAVTSPPRRTGTLGAVSQPLSVSSGGVSSRDPDAIRRSDKGTPSRDSEGCSYPSSPAGSPASNAPIAKGDVDSSSKRTTRAQGITSPLVRSAHAADAAAAPAPTAAHAKSARDHSSSAPPSSPAHELSKSQKDIKPRGKTEDSVLVNWNSFLSETKVSAPADSKKEKEDSGKRVESPPPIERTVGWDSFLAETKSQTVSGREASPAALSRGEVTISKGKGERGQRPSEPDLSKSQRVRTADVTSVPDWEDNMPRARQDTTHVLDFGHAVAGGRSGAIALFIPTATAALQDAGYIINLSFAGDFLTTDDLLSLLQFLKTKLSSLEMLDLSANQLTDEIAPILIDLLARNQVLQDLSLAGNKLTADGLQQLLARPRASLRYLDISHARLDNCGYRFLDTFTGLTGLSRLNVAYTGLSDAEFALLVAALSPSLSSMNARGNKIVSVPDSIGRLTGLRSLDLSRNCLELLSIQLAKLPDLDMDLSGNPCLIMPPKEIALGGGAAIRSWLMANFHGEMHQRLRVFLLGHGGSGKTTLLRTLHRACQLEGVRSAGDGDSVAFSTSDPDSYPKSLDLDPKIRTSVVDFPGMIETTRTYTPFISGRNAICIIVLDPTHQSKRGEKQLGILKRIADYWLSALALRLADQSTSGLRIVVVMTRADQQKASVQPSTSAELFSYIKGKFPSLPIVDRIYSVSNNFNEPEMAKLVKCLRKQAADILAPESHSRVPEMFRSVEQAVQSLAQSSCTVMDLISFKKRAAQSFPDSRLDRYGDYMWSRCMSYLHDTGVLLYSSMSRNVCVQPEAVLRLISAIGVPPAAQRRAYVNTTLGPRPVHTMSRAIVLSRLRSLHPLSHCTDGDLLRILSFMQELDQCFELSEKERSVRWLLCYLPYVSLVGQQLNMEGYWFPALREHAELCALTSAKGGRFMGIQYTDANDFVLNEVFSSLQIALRPYFDPAYRIFSNAMLLKTNDARALVHLTEAGINVVVAGESPRQFLNLLWEKLNFASRVRKEMPQTIKLCPRCIQGAGMYTTMMADNAKCVAGHQIPPAELEEGALWDRKFWCRNSIWTPKYHEQFYSTGDWNTVNENLRYTVLTDADRYPVRTKEYTRIRDMFYHFIREDSVRSFELDRITFLDNLELEFRFQQFFEQCAHRFISYAEPVRSIEALQNEEVLRKEWRRWVMTHFESYQERVSGNDSVNMVPAWHGTSEEVMFKIADKNFLEPEELPMEKQTDPGYFGKGIYFTQYPSYGAQYVKENKCLLFSWVIMGRPYPVIEGPTDDKNLLGKGLCQGFDSHYVMVRQVSPSVYHPCKTSETPDYDEMVVFTKNQILPRYIIYYRRREPEAGAPGVAPVASPNASRYVVWVDDNLHGETKLTIKVLVTLNPSVSYAQVTSTHELIVWIAAHEELLTKEREALRIVTNRYRERDGGEDAAKKLIDTLRGDPKLKQVKVLIYSRNSREVAHLEDKKLTFLAAEPKILREFAAFRAFGDSGGRLFQPLKNLLGRKESKEKDLSESTKERNAKARAVVWVDDKLIGNPSIAQNCASQGIQVVQLSSTTQMKEWMADQGTLFVPRNVRIITNRYRQADGGDNAAAQLLQWLRTADRFSGCETLIFCKDLSKVAHLKSMNTAVTDNGMIASRFCMFESFEKLFPELAAPQGSSSES